MNTTETHLPDGNVGELVAALTAGGIPTGARITTGDGRRLTALETRPAPGSPIGEIRLRFGRPRPNH